MVRIQRVFILYYIEHDPSVVIVVMQLKINCIFLSNIAKHLKQLMPNTCSCYIW